MVCASPHKYIIAFKKQHYCRVTVVFYVNHYFYPISLFTDLILNIFSHNEFIHIDIKLFDETNFIYRKNKRFTMKSHKFYLKNYLVEDNTFWRYFEI